MSILLMIAILGIIAIFSLSLLRALLRELDHNASRKETAALKAQKNAFEQAILKQGFIPGPDEWAAAVASELSQHATAIATNSRRNARVLLVDTSGWFTNVTLPYTQTVAGAAIRPIKARMMLVSTLGRALPALGSYPATNEFAALWNVNDGQVPATTAWTGWTPAQGRDVKVERILLDPFFVSFRVATAKSQASPGQFSIGAPSPLFTAPWQQLTNPPRYLLRGTRVWLYSDVPSGSLLDARQILSDNAFYRYENGIWKSSSVGADLPGGMDIAAVVKGFLDAVPNHNARFGADQQKLVVESMVEYMTGYNEWCKAEFPEGAMKTALYQTQVRMMLRCQELFKESGGSDNYFPVNTTACQ
jgi:hypothetical protein